MGKEEGKVQTSIIKSMEADGWYVIRLVKTNKNGIPDLIAVKPGDNVQFIEVKTEKGVLSPLQKFAHSVLSKMGFIVKTFYGKA